MKYNIAFYLRLSREDGDNIESESIKNQRDILNNFLTKFNCDYKYIDEYIDEGYSGSNFDRPAWKRLLDDIKDKKINTIITKDLSRMGRDYIMMGEYIERIFPENNIRYIAINDDIDTLYETIGLEFLQFKLVFNDYYLKDSSKKIRKVLKSKKENGKFLGKKAVYGYKKFNKYYLVIDNKVEKNVKLIFSLISKGYSINEVCLILKKKKIQNPNSYNKGINNYNWCYRTIKDMIINETYIGNLVQGKRKKINYKSKKEIRIDKSEWIVVNNTHKPIISKRLFNKANEMINKNKYLRNSNNYLLKGLVRCKDCNHRMTLIKRSNKKYLCCSNYLSNMNCSTHLISYNKYEKYINNKVKDFKKINSVLILKKGKIEIIFK